MKHILYFLVFTGLFSCEITTSTNIGVAKNVIGEYPVYKLESYTSGKLSSTTNLPNSVSSALLSITKSSLLSSDSNVNMTLKSTTNGKTNTAGPLGFDVFKSSSTYSGTITDGNIQFELTFEGNESKVIIRNKNVTETILYARK